MSASSEGSEGSNGSERSANSPGDDADSAPMVQVYRLYVTSASPVSSRAVVNARRFLEQHLPGGHQLVVLDIAEHVESARLDQVIASPTLIRIRPLPQRRFIGDMSDVNRLRAALDLPKLAQGPKP